MRVVGFNDDSGHGNVGLTVELDDWKRVDLTVTSYMPDIYSHYEDFGITDDDEGYALSQLVHGISEYIGAKN